MKKKDTQSTKGLIKTFLPYFKNYKRTVFMDLFCAAMTTVCELVLPMIVRKITGAVADSAVMLTVGLILRCTALYLILRAVDTVANYYMATFGHIMGAKIESDMRRDFFAHLQKLSFAYYDDAKVGTLMSRITNDLFDITEFAHHCPEEFFIAGIKIVGSFCILCTINIPLTVIVFAIMPPAVWILSKFRSRMKEGFKESRKQIGELNSQIEDSLLGIRVVKSFAMEDYEQSKFNEGNHKFLQVKSAVYKIMGAFQSSTRLFDGIMYITVVTAGAFFLKSGGIRAADYIAYLMFVSTLTASVRRIVEFSEQFQRGITGIERFAEIMAVDADIKDLPKAKSLQDVKGEIEFRDVSFHYNGTDKNVISHLNLKVKVGESIALVGPSGGGKTTLCSLLPRFYDLSEGVITVDGQDIQKVTLKSLRDNIGTVAQDVYLFSGTIRENIAYGNTDATDEQIAEAARLAGADEFIRELPDGYGSYVGERGVKLSGGQKQRISIARVFLKNPPILILDEATSALDNESEHIVQQSLERLSHGRTTFTIAHRLTTIRNADRILVLTDNGIEESGSHKELIQKNGLYAELYKLYSTDTE